MSDASETGAPKPPLPIFTPLDLGENGGVLAPTSMEELADWIRKEHNFWSWIASTSAGSHRSYLDQAFNMLAAAMATVDEALRHAHNPTAAAERVSTCRRHLESAFLERKAPHSSTPLAKRVEALRQESPTAAIAYLYAFFPQQPSYPFEGRDLGSWQGLIQGINDRFGVTPGEDQLQAQRAAFAELEAKLERLAGEKKAAYDELERRFNELSGKIGSAHEAQQRSFAELLKESEKEQTVALTDHKSQMEALRATFREKMTLRASVDYWTDRAKRHRERADSLMTASFVSLGLLAVALVGGVYWVFDSSSDKAKPDYWKLAALGLVGVLGVWAVRLVVRMFLSDRHLSIDAEERVTMVQTYLALMEDKKVPTDEDRKLILQPLFRPASDGIVKDEGLPHPALEWLTRTGTK